jgi:hypothetical protein
MDAALPLPRQLAVVLVVFAFRPRLKSFVRDGSLSAIPDLSHRPSVHLLFFWLFPKRRMDRPMPLTLEASLSRKELL